MNNVTFFLVDDQDFFRSALKQIAPTCKCVIAPDGVVALQMLYGGEISPDIIFIDLNMPLMKGRQFLQEVNQLKVFEDVPIIILTASEDMNARGAMLELGAKDFIIKPDNFSGWEMILSRVIRNFL